MAKTYFEYTGDGARTVYPVVFSLGYAKEADVHVYTGDDPEDQLSYTWQGADSIELTTAVAVGETFTIRRIVDRSVPENDYQNGAVLEENTLDNSFKQSLMIGEEVDDGFLSATAPQIAVDLSMLSNKIKDVADGESASDATNKGQLDTEISDLTVYTDTNKLDKAGGVMIGPLVVIDTAVGTAAMPKSTINTAIDNAVKAIAGLLPDVDEDYGFITAPVTEIKDYGTLA